MSDHNDGVLYFSELQKESEIGRDKFSVGDEVVFVNGSAAWGTLNGLTGKILDISNDPLWTFCLSIDREDLISWKEPFIDDEGNIRVWCCAGNLMYEHEIPEHQKHHINRGQGKTLPKIDLDVLFPDANVTHKLLELEDLPNLFAKEDLEGKGDYEPDPDQPGSNRDKVALRYKFELEENPKHVLYGMRYACYLMEKGRGSECEKVVEECLKNFPPSLETFQQFHIPVARTLLSRGDLELTKKILLLIPESDRSKLAGYKALISFVWRIERRIDEGQVVKPFIKPILDSMRFIRNWNF